MDNEKKIVVLAGNMEQFRYWLRHNVIPITSKEDIVKLRGIKIGEVYHEGDWYRWADTEFHAELYHLQARYAK